MSKPKSYREAPEPYSTTWNYDVVLYRGEDIVMMGTLKQVAEWLGVQKRTIRYHLTPAASRRAARAKDQSKVMRVVRV